MSPKLKIELDSISERVNPSRALTSQAMSCSWAAQVIGSPTQIIHFRVSFFMALHVSLFTHRVSVLELWKWIVSICILFACSSFYLRKFEHIEEAVWSCKHFQLNTYIAIWSVLYWSHSLLLAFSFNVKTLLRARAHVCWRFVKAYKCRGLRDHLQGVCSSAN